MATGKSFALVLSGSLLASGCGGRTPIDEPFEAAEIGGSSPSGGTSFGGNLTFGGNAPKGGTITYGGFASGGRATGGYSYGGYSQGGYATGGRQTGGRSTGGYSYGGYATGGYSYGGYATGGYSYGGYASGGYSYGGYATGGYSYGGYASGGRGGAGGTCPVWAGCGMTQGGSGGSTQVGGAGGKSTTTPSCVPGASSACTCTDGTSGAQICQADGTYAACTCALSAMRTKILGYWSGTRTTTWDGPQPVKVEFRADGTYSAYCGSSNCIAMYWGVDTDSKEKKYSIDTVNEAGVGFGQLAIYFAAGNTNPGTLKNVRIDASGNGLMFTVWKGEYGPLDFVLKR